MNEMKKKNGDRNETGIVSNQTPYECEVRIMAKSTLYLSSFANNNILDFITYAIFGIFASRSEIDTVRIQKIDTLLHFNWMVDYTIGVVVGGVVDVVFQLFNILQSNISLKWNMKNV